MDIGDVGKVETTMVLNGARVDAPASGPQPRSA